ncbi:hypothetical protein GQ472_02455, partial [archaeon]|nr:hypothetical protein [archaeon]
MVSSTAGDTIKLTENITGQSSTCIDFDGKDNVTFDCQDNYINGTDTASTYGIYLSDANGGSTNTTIRNCNISNFYYGIYLDSSSNNNLTSITSNYNSDHGIYIFLSSNNNLTEITSNYNSRFGIYLHSSSNNNTLNNITSNYNSLYGIYLYTSSNNNLTSITSNYNSQYGIYLRSSSNNTINSANITKSTGQQGLYVSGGSLSYYSTNNFTEFYINDIKIHYFGNSQTACPDDQIIDLSQSPYLDNVSHIQLAGCDNVTVKNGIIDNYDGIYFSFTDNSQINNMTVNNTRIAVGLENSNFNILNDIETSNNSDDGIYLAGSNNNLTLITSNYNSDNGIKLSSSSNNSLTSITSNYNIRGIYLHFGSNNNLTSITSNHNSGSGIQLDSSSNNNLTSITLNYNPGDGILLASDSCNNNITSITVKYNNKGIQFLDDSNDNRVLDADITQNNYSLYLFFNSYGNTFVNSIFNQSNISDIYINGMDFIGSTINDTLINSTFRYDNITFKDCEDTGDICQLNVKWYADVQVNYSNSTAVTDTTVYGYNTTNALIYSANTDNNGFIRLNLTEVEIWSDSSAEHEGYFIYHSNYTVNVTDGTYIDSESVNMSTNRDIQLTLDSTPPIITDVSDNSPKGFGTNITINATVTDTNEVDIVLVEITPPGQSPTNYTMTNITGDVYQYNYTNWENGTYTYKIYANDTSGNLNTSSGHSFDMYVNMTIQVRTLKDAYGANEYVNLTDPPDFAELSSFLNEFMAKATVDEKPADIPAETEETDESNYDFIETEEIDEGNHNFGIQKTRTDVSMQEQKFEWGLVSLNSKKSIYRPGETAELVIITLDRNGNPLCNVEMSMMIKHSDIDDIYYSTADETIISGSECGIYNANYMADAEGNYTIDITALIDGIDISFSTHFLVLEDYGFDIIRTADSSIDPTKQDWFDVRIDIESFVGADSLVVKEFVPVAFEVITDAGVEIVGDAKVLTWDLTLADNKASVSYSYSVPHVWPYLYALGPLEIDNDLQTFTEARPWYIAVDPDSAPVIESYTDIAVLSEATFDVNLPSGTVAGDLLLAIIAKDNDDAMASSHGFTNSFGIQLAASNSVWCWHKIANATDIARGYVTFTGDDEDYVGRMYRITGFDPDTPIDVVDTTGATGTSATPHAPSITTVTNNTLVFAVTGMDDNDVPYSLVTDGWTTDLNTSVTTAGIIIARKVKAIAGFTGNDWDVSTAVYSQEFYVGDKEAISRGLFFKPDGLKMYTIGDDGDTVDEYDLSTAWNVSTAVYIQELNISAKETVPQGLFFKPDGLKMYTIGSDGDTVDEYNLSTAWNVSTAAYFQEFSIAAKELFSRDLFFKPDGLKMYTIGMEGDAVDEYNLSIAWDVSTAVYVQEFYVGAKETGSRDLFFKPDGLKMYTIGDDGDTVDEYNLSIAWNVSTAVYVQEFYVGAKEGGPNGIFFKSDGLKMYTIGYSGDTVDEYDLGVGVNFTMSGTGDGWATAQVAIRANNPPAAVVLNSPEDAEEVLDITPTLEFTGTDPDSDDIEYQVQVDAVDTFNSVVWDVSTAVYSQEFSVVAQENDSSGLFFKPDGLKMYMIGWDGDSVYEYNLSTAWNVSTAVYSQMFNISAKETAPTDFFFKPDGLKMYTIGYSRTVDEYDLSTAWNVFTAVYSQEFDVSAKELSPRGLFFKPDGLKMYTMGYDGDTVDEYNLSIAWNVSTAVYSQELNVSARETSSTGLFFKPDGLKMYTMGYGRTVDEYDLSTAWNVSTAEYSHEFDISVKEHWPTGLFFKSDGTKMYTVGLDGDTVDEYDLVGYPLLDKSSVDDAGFLNTVDGGDTHPFTSGQKISCTVQAADELSEGTYYWRVRGKDPSGVNIYGDWSDTRNFTVNSNVPSDVIIKTYRNSGYSDTDKFFTINDVIYIEANITDLTGGNLTDANVTADILNSTDDVVDTVNLTHTGDGSSLYRGNWTSDSSDNPDVYTTDVNVTNPYSSKISNNTFHLYSGENVSAYHMDYNDDGVNESIMENKHLIVVFNETDDADELILYLEQKDTNISYTFGTILDGNATNSGGITTDDETDKKYYSFLFTSEGENLDDVDYKFKVNLSESYGESVDTLQYKRPVNWTTDGTVNSPENATDFGYNDTTTHADVAAGHVNYTFDLPDGVDDATFFATHCIGGGAGPDGEGYLWNWDTSTFDYIYDTDSGDPRTTSKSLNSSYINSTGGVIFQAKLLGTTHEVYDTHITLPGNTYDFKGIENPSTMSNATNSSDSSDYCSDAWCTDVDASDELSDSQYQKINQTDQNFLLYNLNNYRQLAFNIKINESETSIDSLEVWYVGYDDNFATPGDISGLRYWNGTDWTDGFVKRGMYGGNNRLYTLELSGTDLINAIDSDGYIHIYHRTGGPTHSHTDYIKVDVTLPLENTIISSFNSTISMLDEDVDYLLYKLYNFDSNIYNISDSWSDIAGTMGSSVLDDRYHLENGTDGLITDLTSSQWNDYIQTSSNYSIIYDNFTSSDSVDDNVIAWIRFNETENITYLDVGLWNDTTYSTAGLRIRYNTTSATTTDEVNYILAFTQGDYNTIHQWMSTIEDGSFPTVNFMTVFGQTEPNITINSPDNDTYSTISIWFNVTLDKTGSWCGYSLDGASNVTMDGSGTTWYKENSTMAEGSHNVTFSCNDTAGNMNASAITEYLTIDSIYPIYTTINPSNNSIFYEPAEFSFNITTSENTNMTVYYWNSSDTYTLTNISYTQLPKNTSIPLSVGIYNWNFSVCDEGGLCNQSDTYTFSVYGGITYDEFDTYGSTSNLNFISEDANVSNIILDTSYGLINWTVNVTINKTYDLDTAIDITDNKIFVNTTMYPALNKSAHLVMRELNFGGVKILKDGADCPSAICQNITWDTQTGLLEFDVTEFSEYEAAEANQSKIDNNKTGSLDARIYVLMKVQYYNETSSQWVDDDTVVDDEVTRNISAGELIKLDSLFNGKWDTTANATYGSGTYRVYAAVTDESDDVLKNVDGTWLNATFNFTIDTGPPSITIDSPDNDTYNTASVWFNVTLGETGSWCGYSLDGAANVTMDGSGTTWYKENSTMTIGSHNVTFSCNDTEGNMNASEVTEYFTVYGVTSINPVLTDESSPNVGDVVNLSARLLNSTSDALEWQNISFYYNSTYIGSNITNSTGWAVYMWDTLSVGASGTYFI